MAFFKFRKGADDAPAATVQPESVETLRRRARHRLIGAGVLVLLGVIGFPLLFDTQPRPVAVDIPIEIPDRNKAKPLPAPPPSRAQGVVLESGAATPPARSTVAAASPAAPAVKAEAGTPSRDNARAEQVAKVVPAPIDKPAAPAPKTAPPAEAGRAQSLLEGKPVQAAAQEAAAGARFVVQVGAFADAGKARDAQMKLEKAGLKAYTQVADTKDGKRSRVRAGPFATRAEADKAAGRIKDLELPVKILEL